MPIPDGLDVTPELHGDDVTLETALQAVPAPEAPVTADDLCIMPYTSGTTGLPKGCMHTHRSVQANVFGAGAWWTATSRTCSWRPCRSSTSPASSTAS